MWCQSRSVTFGSETMTGACTVATDVKNAKYLHLANDHPQMTMFGTVRIAPIEYTAASWHWWLSSLFSFYYLFV